MASSTRPRGTRRSPEIDRRLTPILEEHGSAIRSRPYIGKTPNAHNLRRVESNGRRRGLAGARPLKNLFLGEHGRPDAEAGWRPGLMFGTMLGVPIPDIGPHGTTC